MTTTPSPRGTQAMEQRLKTCLTAVQRLRCKGCEVLNVDLGNIKPVIVIGQPNANKLGGEVDLIENTGKGRQEVRVSRFAGCLVKWRKPL